MRESEEFGSLFNTKDIGLFLSTVFPIALASISTGPQTDSGESWRNMPYYSADKKTDARPEENG